MFGSLPWFHGILYTVYHILYTILSFSIKREEEGRGREREREGGSGREREGAGGREGERKLWFTHNTT